MNLIRFQFVLEHSESTENQEYSIGLCLHFYQLLIDPNFDFKVENCLQMCYLYSCVICLRLTDNIVFLLIV